MKTETALAAPDNAALIEQVVMAGDLSKLSPSQRMDYYRLVCESAGLNPLTSPFQYLTLNGKLVLYAGKNAAEQIRRNQGISVTKLEPTQDETTFNVYAYGIDKTGRTDAALGSVSIKGLTGEALSNAKMKAETKAKRRLTLSLSGLGFLDETEVGSIPGAERVDVDLATGEIISKAETEVKTLRQLAEAAADAAESPQQPPSDPEEGEVVPVGAETDSVAPTAPEVESLPLFSETPEDYQSPEDLSVWEFKSLCTKAGLGQAAVKATAKRLYPEAKTSADLTDVERGRLWIVLATEQGQ